MIVMAGVETGPDEFGKIWCPSLVPSQHTQFITCRILSVPKSGHLVYYDNTIPRFNPCS